VAERSSHPWRSYSDAERAEAVGLMLAIGAKKAAAQTGVPLTTLYSWRRQPTATVQAAIGRTRDDVAARLWEAVTAGTDAVLAGLRDPKARLGDKASALRIVVEAHALISGAATSRTETIKSPMDGLTPAEQDSMRQFIVFVADATDEELVQFAADGGLLALRGEEATDVG
jgi:transposase-like protein